VGHGWTEVGGWLAGADTQGLEGKLLSRRIYFSIPLIIYARNRIHTHMGIYWIFILYSNARRRTNGQTDGRTDGQRTCQHQHHEKEQEWNQRTRRVAGRLSGVARYRTYRTGPGLMGEYVMCV